jgi:hypothetical protein
MVAPPGPRIGANRPHSCRCSPTDGRHEPGSTCRTNTGTWLTIGPFTHRMSEGVADPTGRDPSPRRSANLSASSFLRPASTIACLVVSATPLPSPARRELQAIQSIQVMLSYSVGTNVDAMHLHYRHPLARPPFSASLPHVASAGNGEKHFCERDTCRATSRKEPPPILRPRTLSDRQGLSAPRRDPPLTAAARRGILWVRLDWGLVRAAAGYFRMV